MSLNLHWLLCCSRTKHICFFCLLRKINRDDVVILDSLNYIKGKFALVCFSIVFIYAFMFKNQKIFCRLQIWIILSHQARTDPPLSGEHPRCFELKLSTFERLKSNPVLNSAPVAGLLFDVGWSELIVEHGQGCCRAVRPGHVSEGLW